MPCNCIYYLHREDDSYREADQSLFLNSSYLNRLFYKSHYIYKRSIFKFFGPAARIHVVTFDLQQSLVLGGPIVDLYFKLKKGGAECDNEVGISSSRFGT